MEPIWKKADDALSHMKVSGKPNNEPVTVSGSSESLVCIGIGTDAAVFRYLPLPQYAFKVYSPEALSKKEVEASVYNALQGSEYFAKCYGSGDRYLVLSYEPGVTLFDCLLQGITIPPSIMDQVDQARDYVRGLGLNPRDIHLKNVLVQGDRAKLIDVSEYVKEGDDRRWEHLRLGYDEFYPWIDGRPIPLWMLETIKKWYYRMDSASFAVEEFGKKTMDLFIRD
jgi:hypothetical protein